MKPKTKGFLKKIMDGFKKFYLMDIKKIDPNKLVLCTLVYEGDRSEVEY